MDHRKRHHRRRRFGEPGHVHELTFSCYRKYRFLTSERACGWLTRSISEARGRWDFDLWAYVFMPEHVHLIVRPRGVGTRVDSILKGIKQSVGRRAFRYLEAHAPQWLPKLTRERNGRVERLFWQPDGGYDRNLVEPRTLASAMSYVHANPVRRGLVEWESDLRWSSAGWYQGEPKNDLRPDPILPEWC
jgi:putative transposase